MGRYSYIVMKEVAVKLQYPGVEKSIVSDLKNLKMILKFPGVLP
jgi:predicted unusual protein kinase regulating ubiquinone biosynthesis (AarF/ABC1/UbiB family)